MPSSDRKVSWGGKYKSGQIVSTESRSESSLKMHSKVEVLGKGGLRPSSALGASGVFPERGPQGPPIISP